MFGSFVSDWVCRNLSLRLDLALALEPSGNGSKGGGIQMVLRAFC